MYLIVVINKINKKYS